MIGVSCPKKEEVCTNLWLLPFLHPKEPSWVWVLKQFCYHIQFHHSIVSFYGLWLNCTGFPYFTCSVKWKSGSELKFLNWFENLTTTSLTFPRVHQHSVSSDKTLNSKYLRWKHKIIGSKGKKKKNQRKSQTK